MQMRSPQLASMSIFPISRRRRLLLKQAGGPERIRQMMIDDIHKALDEGQIRHGAELFMALRHFLEHHPEARRGLAGD